MKSLQDFIFVIPDVVPTELRAKILQEYAKSDDWKPSVIGRNYDLVKEVRDVDEIAVSEPTTIEKNSVVRKTIDDELFVCANAVLTKYTANYKDFTKIHTEKDEGYVLLR